MWYHKRPYTHVTGYYACSGLIQFIYRMLLTNWMQPTHLSGAQLFSRHIFHFEILPFIEIIIDITTGGHQLKIRFLFLIVYKNGLFHILGFSSNQKKKNSECRMLLRNFAEDVPYYAAHDFRPFTACSIFLWFICLNVIWYHFLGINRFKQCCN